MTAKTSKNHQNSHEIAGVDISTHHLQEILEKCYNVLKNSAKNYVPDKPETSQNTLISTEHNLSPSIYPLYTVNPEFIALADEFAVYKKVLNNAFIAVPDGIGILYAGLLKHTPFRGRITGIDLVDKLSMLASEHNFRVGYIGGRPHAAEKTKQLLTKRYPGLDAWSDAGPSISIYESAMRENNKLNISEIIKIDQSNYNVTDLMKRIYESNIIFVAFGAPKQELFIEYLKKHAQLKQPIIAVGVGGALDEISGVSLQPPAWVQKIGMKWLFRLGTEPWRWRRQLRLLKFTQIMWKDLKRSD